MRISKKWLAKFNETERMYQDLVEGDIGNEDFDNESLKEGLAKHEFFTHLPEEIDLTTFVRNKQMQQVLYDIGDSLHINTVDLLLCYKAYWYTLGGSILEIPSPEDIPYSMKLNRCATLEKMHKDFQTVAIAFGLDLKSLTLQKL